jgi:hypothetical protein
MEVSTNFMAVEHSPYRPNAHAPLGAVPKWVERE